jgi:hypothetical protein
MRDLGLNGSTVNLLVAGGINIVQFLAVIPAILYIDQWGGWPSGPPPLALIFLDRAKASAPRRQRRDDHIPSTQRLIGMSAMYVVDNQCLHSWITGFRIRRRMGEPSDRCLGCC